MGEASRRKKERRELRGQTTTAWILDEEAMVGPVPGAKYTEARGADGNMYAWVGDTPPPGYVEPPRGPGCVVTEVDRERRTITVTGSDA